jgi:hypothetical protein
LGAGKDYSELGKKFRMLSDSLYCPYVRPLHVERPETENSHAKKGHCFGPSRVNEEFPDADNRLETREKEFFVDTRENSSLAKSDQNRNVAVLNKRLPCTRISRCLDSDLIKRPSQVVFLENSHQISFTRSCH